MTKDILFIGYPKCSTCQKAEKFLRAHGCGAPMRDIKAERAEGQAARDDGGGAVRTARHGRDARQASPDHHAEGDSHGISREGVGGAAFVTVFLDRKDFG